MCEHSCASTQMVNTTHIRIYWRYQFELFVYIRIIVLVRHPFWNKDLVSNLFRSTCKTHNWFHGTWQSYLDSHQNKIEHSLYIYYVISSEMHFGLSDMYWWISLLSYLWWCQDIMMLHIANIIGTSLFVWIMYSLGWATYYMHAACHHVFLATNGLLWIL